MKLIADLSPLHSGWRWHCPEEDCHCSDILTSTGEGRRLFAPLIVVDVTVDIMGPAPG
jgi:hypothetical protein